MRSTSCCSPVMVKVLLIHPRPSRNLILRPQKISDLSISRTWRHSKMPASNRMHFIASPGAIQRSTRPDHRARARSTRQRRSPSWQPRSDHRKCATDWKCEQYDSVDADKAKHLESAIWLTVVRVGLFVLRVECDHCSPSIRLSQSFMPEFHRDDCNLNRFCFW